MIFTYSIFRCNIYGAFSQGSAFEKVRQPIKTAKGVLPVRKILNYFCDRVMILPDDYTFTLFVSEINYFVKRYVPYKFIHNFPRGIIFLKTIKTKGF